MSHNYPYDGGQAQPQAGGPAGGYRQAPYPSPNAPQGYPQTSPAMPPGGYPPPAPGPAAGAASWPQAGTPAPTPTGDPTRALTVVAATAVPVILAISLLVPEGGSVAIKAVTGWSLVALASGVMVTVGAFVSGPAGRRLRIAGAGGVTSFWVLISLPAITRNTALGVTLAMVAALWVAWRLERTP